jgi:hypothetical protein
VYEIAQSLIKSSEMMDAYYAREFVQHWQEQSGAFSSWEQERDLFINTENVLLAINYLQYTSLLGRIPWIRIKPKILTSENKKSGSHENGFGITSSLHSKDEMDTVKHEFFHLVWHATKCNNIYHPEGNQTNNLANYIINIFKNEAYAYSTSIRSLLQFSYASQIGLKIDKPLYHYDQEKWNHICEWADRALERFNAFCELTYLSTLTTWAESGDLKYDQRWRVKILKIVSGVTQINQLNGTMAGCF